MKRWATSVIGTTAFVLVVQMHSAWAGEVHIVDLLAGTTVDVCVDGAEVMSDAGWNDMRKDEYADDVQRTITLRASDPGTCTGTFLDADTFDAQPSRGYRFLIFPDRRGAPSLRWHGYDWSRTRPGMANVSYCHIARAARLDVIVDGRRLFCISNAEDSYCWGWNLPQGRHRIRLEYAATGDPAMGPRRLALDQGREYSIFFTTRTSGAIVMRTFDTRVGVRR